MRQAMARSEIVVVHARNGDGSIVANRLAFSPFEITALPIGRTMIDSLVERQPAVIVVDHDSGEFDLTRVCHDLSTSIESPIIVVSGNDGDPDEPAIRALDAGAGVVLTHDTSTPLVVAHIRVALRARPFAPPIRAEIEIGDVVVDLNAHATFIAGEVVKCPPRQFLLLATLARHPNIVLDHDALMTSVWGEQTDAVDPRRLRIAVSLLRSVLGTGPRRPRIETVSHVGYRLVVDPLISV